MSLLSSPLHTTLSLFAAIFPVLLAEHILQLLTYSSRIHVQVRPGKFYGWGIYLLIDSARSSKIHHSCTKDLLRLREAMMGRLIPSCLYLELREVPIPLLSVDQRRVTWCSKPCLRTPGKGRTPRDRQLRVYEHSPVTECVLIQQ
ncbi:hypothetical protein V8E53_013098 [Lactarius tabidus]